MLDGGPGDDVLWMDSGPDADPDVLIGGDGFDIAGYGRWRGDGQGLRLSIDGVANDGVPGEDDEIHTDIEGLRAATRTTSWSARRATTTSPAEAGTTCSKAATVTTISRAADGALDHVECGDGSDRVWRDANDDVDGDCELSTIGPRSADPGPMPTPTPAATPTPVIHLPITPARRPVATPPADTTAPDASVNVAAEARAATLRRRRLTLTVRCNERCIAKATLKSRRGTVATGSLRGSGTSRRTLRMRLTATGRRALTRGRCTVTDGAGNTSSVVRTLTTGVMSALNRDAVGVGSSCCGRRQLGMRTAR